MKTKTGFYFYLIAVTFTDLFTTGTNTISYLDRRQLSRKQNNTALTGITN